MIHSGLMLSINRPVRNKRSTRFIQTVYLLINLRTSLRDSKYWFGGIFPTTSQAYPAYIDQVNPALPIHSGCIAGALIIFVINFLDQGRHRVNWNSYRRSMPRHHRRFNEHI